MLKSANLFFYTDKINQISFGKNTKPTKFNNFSEYSFEKALKNYQKNQEPFQRGLEKDSYESVNNQTGYMSSVSQIKKEVQRDLEDEIELDLAKDEPGEDAANLADVSHGAHREIVIELLNALLNNLNEDKKSIMGERLFESLKVVVPSIEKAAADEPISYTNILEDLQMAFKSIFPQETELNIGDNSPLMYNIQKVLELLSYAGSESGAGKQVIPIDDMENILYPDVMYNAVSPEIEHYHQSSVESLSNNIYRVIQPNLKETMSKMEAAGMGKRILASLMEAESMEDTVDTKINDDNLAEAKTAHSLIKQMFDAENAENEVKAIGQSSKGKLMESNLKEKMPSNLDPLADTTMVDSIKPSNSNEILDFTHVIEKNNPAASIELIQELAEKISINLKTNRHEMELQIKPESLGRLVLKVTLEDGVLSGKIFTTSQQTRDILQKNLADLKNALEQQGYSFSHLDVDVGNGQEPGQFHQPGRSPVSLGKNKRFTNSFSNVNGFTEEKQKPIGPYAGLSEIDYFA